MALRKLGRTSDQRRAMLRQLTTDLLEKGHIRTTVTRCKEVKPIADKIITLGKRAAAAAGTLDPKTPEYGRAILPYYRRAISYLTREDVAHKVFQEHAATYAERNGGYTRILRLGPRRGDSAEIAQIELV